MPTKVIGTVEHQKQSPVPGYFIEIIFLFINSVIPIKDTLEMISVSSNFLW